MWNCGRRGAQLSRPLRTERKPRRCSLKSCCSRLASQGWPLKAVSSRRWWKFIRGQRSHSYAREGRTGDQHDAYGGAAWLSRADRNGTLAAFLKPDLAPPERAVAQMEGWIVGVPGSIRVGNGKINSSSVIFGSTSSTNKRTRPMKATEPGYFNKNGQVVLRKTDVPGNDHNRIVYVLRCDSCRHEYGANGSDIGKGGAHPAKVARRSLPIERPVELAKRQLAILACLGYTKRHEENREARTRRRSRPPPGGDLCPRLLQGAGEGGLLDPGAVEAPEGIRGGAAASRWRRNMWTWRPPSRPAAPPSARWSPISRRIRPSA